MVVTMSKGFRFMKNSWVTTMVKDQGADKVRGKVGDVGVIGRRRGAGAVHHVQQPGVRAPGEPGSTHQMRAEGVAAAWRSQVQVRGLARNGGKRIISMRSMCSPCGGGDIPSIILSGRLTRARRASGAELGMRDCSNRGNADGSEVGGDAGDRVWTTNTKEVWRAERH